MEPRAAALLVLGVQTHLHSRCMHYQAHDGVEHASAASPVPPEHVVVFDHCDHLQPISLNARTVS